MAKALSEPVVLIILRGSLGTFTLTVPGALSNIRGLHSLDCSAEVAICAPILVTTLTPKSLCYFITVLSPLALAENV